MWAARDRIVRIARIIAEFKARGRLVYPLVILWMLTITWDAFAGTSTGTSICATLVDPNAGPPVKDRSIFYAAKDFTPLFLKGLGNVIRGRPSANGAEVIQAIREGKFTNKEIQALVQFFDQPKLTRNPQNAQEILARTEHGTFKSRNSFEVQAFEKTLLVRDNLVDALKILEIYDSTQGTTFARDAALGALEELQVFDGEWLALLEAAILKPKNIHEDAISASGYLNAVNMMPPSMQVARAVHEEAITLGIPDGELEHPRILGELASASLRLHEPPAMVAHLFVIMVQRGQSQGLSPRQLASMVGVVCVFSSAHTELPAIDQTLHSARVTLDQLRRINLGGWGTNWLLQQTGFYNN